MTPPARLSAAIEVLADIEDRRRPAGDALKDWGLAHRFAGSGDRAAIGGLGFDALRRRRPIVRRRTRWRRRPCAMMPPPMCAATIRTGSTPILRRYSARNGPTR